VIDIFLIETGAQLSSLDLTDALRAPSKRMMEDVSERSGGDPTLGPRVGSVGPIGSGSLSATVGAL
jgi:hypothetical protein